MLAFFILEKAVAEIAHDLANRPSWVGVPIRAVLDILTKSKRVPVPDRLDRLTPPIGGSRPPRGLFS
jgi:hypothetical protein